MSSLFSLVEDFFSHLKWAENKSPHTLLSYKRDLKKYKDYQSRKKNQKKILFEEYLSRKGLSPRSRARAMSAVRSYLRFLEDQGSKLPQTAVVHRESLAPLSVQSKLPRFVSHLEFKKILKASAVNGKIYETKRNQLTLYLLFGLACRVSELVSLNVSDYMESDESIVITGKGSKQRILPVTEPLLSSLRDYISDVRGVFAEKQPRPAKALILNNRGRRPSRVDVWRWIQKFCKIAGVSVKSPHQFRHGCASELLDQGADLRSIQTLLGHSSIETTKIYTHITRRKLTKTISAHHPLSRLKAS